MSEKLSKHDKLELEYFKQQQKMFFELKKLKKPIKTESEKIKTNLLVRNNIIYKLLNPQEV